MSRLEKIRTMLEESPADVLLNYTYAMELAKGDDIDATRQAFQQTLALDPNYVPAHFQLGQALSRADLIAEAQTVLRSGIEIARRQGDAHALGEMTEFLENLS